MDYRLHAFSSTKFLIILVVAAAVFVNAGILLKPGEKAEQSFCFAIDSSISMAGGPSRQVTAAAEAAIGALPEGTRAALVAFQREAELLVPLTEHRGLILKELGRLVPSGATGISEGLAAAAESLTGVEGKKEILLFTDGRNGEERIPGGLERKLREEEIRLWILVTGRENNPELRELSEMTGGSFRQIEDLKRTLEEMRGGAGPGALRIYLLIPLDAGMGFTVLLCLRAEYRKKRQRKGPLPNAGYLKKEEIKDIIREKG